MICKICNSSFSRRHTDETGRVRYFRVRNRCLKCFPFNRARWTKERNKKCIICSRSFSSEKDILKCNKCRISTNKKKKLLFLFNLMGKNCWRCNYGGDIKYYPILEMHHVNPKEKLFNVSGQNVSSRSIEEIIKEAKKCILLCRKCHAEHHYSSLFPKRDIDKLYLKWDTINIEKEIEKYNSK